MTRPTDDELEAMAVRLDQSDANEYSYDNDKDDAAAMLRACKAGDAPDHSDWNAAIEAAAEYVESLDGYDSIGGTHPLVAAIRAIKKGTPND